LSYVGWRNAFLPIIRCTRLRTLVEAALTALARDLDKLYARA
jgi:hypothetical protein